jgi:hypothetical protein
MRRRDFIIAFGSVAAVSARSAMAHAQAQQKAKVYRIAFVSPSEPVEADMLKAAEPLAAGWFRRQLETTHITLDTVEKLSRCSDMAEAVTIQREWFEAAARRLTTELENLTEQAASISREAVSATQGAMQRVSEAAPISKRLAEEPKIEAAA